MWRRKPAVKPSEPTDLPNAFVFQRDSQAAAACPIGFQLLLDGMGGNSSERSRPGCKGGCMATSNVVVAWPGSVRITWLGHVGRIICRASRLLTRYSGRVTDSRIYKCMVRAKLKSSSQGLILSTGTRSFVHSNARKIQWIAIIMPEIRLVLPGPH